MSVKACDGCTGDDLLVPAALDNRPGLAALARRVGAHGSFKQTMLALLARQAALEELTTRSDDDPAIALIDAWAMVLDVLTFYQERIANEGYLRTATEELSLKQLARSISYRPRPGVAAETWLAFDVEAAAPGSAGKAIIPQGVKVQSIPFPGELPQTFETMQPLDADAAWNRLPLQTRGAQLLTESTRDLYLQGVATQLQKGDALLIAADARIREASPDTSSARWALRFVVDMQTDPGNNWTWVKLDQALGAVSSADAPSIFALRQRAALFGHNPPAFLALAPDTQKAYISYYASQTPPVTITDDWPTEHAGAVIDLDAAYPRIAPESWVVLASAGEQSLYGVSSLSNPSLSKWTLSAKVTRITPDTPAGLSAFDLRATTVYAQSEPLALAQTPVTTPVSGSTLTLAAAIAGLAKGRVLLIAGKTTAGAESGEAAVIETVIETVAGAAITLQQPLAQAYAVQTVAVYGNVVAATHGESKGEVLGSGNGALLFQKFELKNKPLTYIPAAAEPSGSQTTLQVRVNAVLWEEAPAFYGRGPRDRIYTTQRADDGTVTVQFGDGLAGARLPSGVENVTAGYRVGSGAAGLLQPSQLSLLLTRPLGVRSVTNPLASLNAVDPESGAAIRFNAPLTVLTFDRIVSLQDFERFAGAYAGVAKVQALALRNGEEQIVYLSVAGANNTLIDAANPLSARLASAMQAAGAPARSFRLLPHSARTFGLQARIVLLPGHRPEDVQSRLAGSLAAAFSFAQRSLGQPVTRSELIAAMQAVEGVAAVALDSMFLTPAATAYLERLPAQPIRRTQAGIVGAELLTIDMAQVTLTVAPGLSA